MHISQPFGQKNLNGMQEEAAKQQTAFACMVNLRTPKAAERPPFQRQPDTNSACHDSGFACRLTES